MFLIFKHYPNRTSGQYLGTVSYSVDKKFEPIKRCASGAELDAAMMEIGECAQPIGAANYWELHNVNLRTMEVI